MPVFIELNPAGENQKPFLINTDQISTIHHHDQGSQIFEVGDPDNPFVVTESVNEVLGKIPTGL